MIKNIQWHRIFNKKKFSYIKDTNKIKYKNINNFSYNLAKVIYPGLNHFKFLKITNFISKKLNIIIKKSILDFGSGNGSFLNYFVNKYNLKNNISLEISGPLLNQQKKFIKKTIFFKTHHTDTKVFDKLNANLVDYSMCNSVFQYFYNENYAYKVLDFLLKITKKKILIYDIKNSKTKKIYQEKVRKRQNLSILKFKEKYKKTPIRFYEKNTLKKILTKLQKKYVFNFTFKNLPREATDYKYGYCLLIKKKNMKIR